MDRPTQTSVSLYQYDKQIVRANAVRRGLDFSNSLRTIIREWNEYKQAGVTLLPHPDGAHPAPVIETQP